MMLIEVTMVPDGALPVEQFKAHLRLGSGFGEDSVQDAVLVSFLRAALTAVEARTSKVLIEREFSLSLTQWAEADSQAIPVAPVTAVTGVTLVSRAGDPSVVDSDTFWLERDTHQPRLRSVGACLPTIPVSGSAQVAFRAGYVVDWAGVPADLAQAVMLRAAHYYEYRQETSLSEGCMPFGVTSLIERYKVMRLGGAR